MNLAKKTNCTSVTYNSREQNETHSLHGQLTKLDEGVESDRVKCIYILQTPSGKRSARDDRWKRTDRELELETSAQLQLCVGCRSASTSVAWVREESRRESPNDQLIGRLTAAQSSSLSSCNSSGCVAGGF